tara:strand:- start:231 stop:731 length:501 start_codon:yes stop_codon:yes gene_type:complete
MSTLKVNTIQNVAGAAATLALVQVVSTQTGSVATGTTAIPWDDTIPLITDGDLYMTRTITPTNTGNTLKIDVSGSMMTTSASNSSGFTLFRDSDACIAGTYAFTTAYEVVRNSFTHYIFGSLGTSEISFTVRGGGVAGTFTFNGYAGATKYAGVESASITISEIRA